MADDKKRRPMNSTAFRQNRDQVENPVNEGTSCSLIHLVTAFQEAADQVKNQVEMETGCLHFYLTTAFQVGLIGNLGSGNHSPRPLRISSTGSMRAFGRPPSR